MNMHEQTDSTTNSVEIFEAWYEDQLQEDDEKIKNGQSVDFND